MNEGNRERGEVPERTDDAQKPEYHYTPPANWMNDPNGLIQWKGLYHMFYQYNPLGAYHYRIHWGHAVSLDLIHWTDLPVALLPDEMYDQDGCWSGCAFDNEGVPALMYTGFTDGQQVPCLATSQDDLQTLTKYRGNPVIAGPPEGLDVLGFRDHCVWREGEMWYQAIGSGIRDVGGAVLLYSSADLKAWEYVGPILVGDKHQTEPLLTGTMWECPDLFRLDDKHVLSISVEHESQPLYTAYFVGKYANYRFEPEGIYRLDYGTSFYAPQSFLDERGRRILIGWLREERDGDAQREAGWSGAMSIPRVLEMREDGKLGMKPLPELESLRGEVYEWRDVALGDGEAFVPDDLAGELVELEIDVELGDAEEFGLYVRCSPEREELTYIYFRRADAMVGIDTSRASLSGSA